MPIKWLGQQVTAEIAQRAVDALTEIDLRIESEAKQQLYEGHGKRTGNLQRAIIGEAATQQGSRVVGVVGVKGVPYAMRIHDRYGYITEAVDQVKGQALDIVKKHMP